VTSADISTSCSIVAHSTVEASLARIAQLRDDPGARDAAGQPTGPQLARRFLRHCDEHTVVGMAAVLEAICRMPAGSTDFSRWGVLAAPCLAGRLMSAETLSQLHKTGATAVSPHIIPQCSLHAMASAVSVGLGMHGPNIGVGGGPQAVAEGLVTALTLLDDPGVPGIWLVLTQWDEEPIPDGEGGATGAAVCRGTALALMARDATAGRSAAGLTLSLRIPSGPLSSANTSATPLGGFASALDGPGSGGAVRWSHACDWGGRLEVA
jgi:hypothetical protein